ncbi:MAG TPA: sugar-binding protein, partial [Rugosimonospora sp.]|nr:sugar-binding protein [Rugosimonospora sp.]
MEHAQQYRPSATTWPGAAHARILLPAPAGTRHDGAQVGATGIPLWAQAMAVKPGAASAGQAHLDLQMFDHGSATRAGVTGVLFTVSGATATGPVRVGLDYTGFAQAYGGNYGSRLRLVQVPGCALTTPQVAACRRQTPVASVNDPAAQTLSASVQVTASAAAMVLAATTDPGQEGGAAGSYAATSLKPSGSWTAGGSGGSFAYSYPVTVPPAASSLVPKVALSYDSSSLDGQTATTYAQSSWVGDGWTSSQSFVEQSFVSCADSPEGSASPTSTGDMCYDGPVLTLSLDGSTTSLVWDSGRSVWKPQQDDGEVVNHVTGSNNGTGTYNTDYWTVIDRTGTVYMFGRNQIPGWSSGKATTNSVDSQPVYSAHSGDPCYNSAGFTSSVCTMAYRWNLDYVKDVHGNAMAYYYKEDTNFYGQDNGAKNTSYVRDSHLDHIDYGFTDGNAFGTVPDRVVFATADRCVSGTCDPLNATTSANWPDVPYDLVCASGATCSSYSPSFFSTVRLASISTQQYSSSAAKYATVDTYTLSQTLPTPTNGTSPTLWLASIGHTGSDTTAAPASSAITLPDLTFTPIALANRVDTVTDGLPPLYRYRIATVTSETGAVTAVSYGQPNPCTAPVTTTPSANTSSCYPVYWTPQGYT